MFFASMVLMAWKVAQLVSGTVEFQGVHASEAVADAEIQRAHELVLLAPGTSVPALGVVRRAISGTTVAAENTIDQTNRKNRVPEARSW